MMDLVGDQNEKAVQVDILALLIPKVAQQCVERIDRTRKIAGLTFTSLLHR